MRPFAYERATGPAAAVRAASAGATDAHVRAHIQYLAGGTTLVDLMKLRSRTGAADRSAPARAATARHRGGTPHIETTLAPGDLITGFFVPAGPWTRRSASHKGT